MDEFLSKRHYMDAHTEHISTRKILMYVGLPDFILNLTLTSQYMNSSDREPEWNRKSGKNPVWMNCWHPLRTKNPEPTLIFVDLHMHTVPRKQDSHAFVLPVPSLETWPLFNLFRLRIAMFWLAIGRSPIVDSCWRRTLYVSMISQVRRLFRQGTKSQSNNWHSALATMGSS